MYAVVFMGIPWDVFRMGFCYCNKNLFIAVVRHMRPIPKCRELGAFLCKLSSNPCDD
jgi:hypothetical protein